MCWCSPSLRRAACWVDWCGSVLAPPLPAKSCLSVPACAVRGGRETFYGVNHRSVAPSTTIKTGYVHLQVLGTSSLITSIWRCMRAYKRVRSPNSVRASAARGGGETFQNHKTIHARNQTGYAWVRTGSRCTHENQIMGTCTVHEDPNSVPGTRMCGAGRKGDLLVTDRSCGTDGTPRRLHLGAHRPPAPPPPHRPYHERGKETGNARRLTIYTTK